MSDGRPVPPPKPVLYQQQQQPPQPRPPQWHPSDGRQDNFNNNKRISQDMAHSPPRGMPPPHENSVPPYGHGPPSRRSDGSEFSGMSPLYGSRNYMDPPPMRPPPSVPENPYQSRHPNRRPYHEENNFDSRNHDPRSRDPRGHGHDPRSRGHTNYEMPPPPPVYHKNDYSPHRPVAQVNGTTSYHNMPMRHNEHSYHSDHHLGSPPAPSSLLDLSNRENRGSAFELYKKPDGRSPHHGMPLHLNCEMPK